MGLYFHTRFINTSPEQYPGIPSNTLLPTTEDLPGGYLITLLEEEYPDLLMWRGDRDNREYVGDVCDPINVEYGEKPTVAGCIKEHEALREFLLTKLVDETFCDLDKAMRYKIRELYKMVTEALRLQRVLDTIGAPVIVTVTWG